MAQNQYTESYRVITGPGQGEIVEKKSRFIASIMPVQSEEEALAFIEKIRKEHYAARHNCFAFIIGKKSELERCSDDGEPSGTAGRPMLEVLKGTGLTNVAAVVTRYFGGVLLGTGGLSRAYTQSLQEGLNDCEIVTMRYGVSYTITADYTMTGKLQYIFAKRDITVEETEYTDVVRFHVTLASDREEIMKKEVTEATGAKAVIEKTGDVYFVDKGGQS